MSDMFNYREASTQNARLIQSLKDRIVELEVQLRATLAPVPHPVEMPEGVWKMLDKALSYWYANCDRVIFLVEDVDTERRRISEVAVWLDEQRPEEAQS